MALLHLVFQTSICTNIAPVSEKNKCYFDLSIKRRLNRHKNFERRIQGEGLPPEGGSELTEIFVQVGAGVNVPVLIRFRKQFPGSAKLHQQVVPQGRILSSVFDSCVYQVQRTYERSFRHVRFSLLHPFESAPDFATNVCHLLGQRQGAPSEFINMWNIVCQFEIYCLTISKIFFLISSFSTSRLILFWRGRMLMRESNSTKSSSSASG